MKIQVGGLSEGLHTYHFEAPATDFDLGGAFSGPVAVEAKLEKSGHQLLLRASVATEGKFVCDRCALHFSRTISDAYRMVYAQDAAELTGVDPSEVQIIPPGFGVIDITDDVRQTLLLAVPLKLLCREECKGLCPQCGTNWNEQQCDCRDLPVDSRWDKLRSLPRN
jgi:uncharacterized protein